eukprot:4546521-Pyramimonas_sp.AAC.1
MHGFALFPGALYQDAWAEISMGNGSQGYWASRGMKQGCPLSGVLFALILEPALAICYNFGPDLNLNSVLLL